MKIETISYDIIALDPIDDSWVDNIDGEFETLEIANKFFDSHRAQDIANWPEDQQSKLVIRKIVRSYNV